MLPNSLAHRPEVGRVIVIGGGPAGLMACDVLAAAGVQVDLFDAMPSVGRKFLLAGKGGLNLTHSESFEAFVARYGVRAAHIEPLLRRFDADALRAWASDLGVPTFIGSSGRVFPHDLKAAPLLRAWLARLRARGVRFRMRHRWIGWEDVLADSDAGVLDGDAGAGADRAVAASPAVRFVTPQGQRSAQADAVVLALGGGSWSRLGSDGTWQGLLEHRGVSIAPLRPSNCGFEAARIATDATQLPGWSQHFRSRFAGHALKNVAVSIEASDGGRFQQRGEFVASLYGVEGSLIYAASALLRDEIERSGQAVAWVDLLPARSAAFVLDEVRRPRGSRSLSTHLKSRLGIDGVKAALLHELLPREVFADAPRLATAIKALPLWLTHARPLDEAISSAGGVRFEALDATLQVNALPGVFCAGEMLDWEAPTGGYLLGACFASGVAAAEGVLARLASR